MLFDKNNNGTSELKEFIGFFYESNNFDKIKMDIELAEEDIKELIGADVYNLANNHYNDLSEDSGSGSGSGSGGGISSALLDNLVKHIQLPVALFACKSFIENNDVSHEDTGRKVKIDEESEKLPWEWMLDRDNAAILKKAHRATDRLISFLDEYEDSISEWKNSTAKETARQCFLQNAQEFNEIFPIDSSRSFYLRILPFMKYIEKTRIKSYFDQDVYELIKEAIKDGDTEEYDNVITLVKDAVAPLTMSRAIKRLAITLLPEGILQSYVSERNTTQAKQVPTIDIINNVATTLENDGAIALTRLQEYLAKQDADEFGEDYEPEDPVPENDEDNKYFRT